MAKGTPSIGQLIKRIHSNEIAPAYSLFGNESFLQDFFIHELATYFLGDSGTKKHISLDDDQQDQVLADLSAFSLFSERELLVVRQIRKLSVTARKELVDYLKNPNGDTCLVLIAEDYDDRNSLQKLLKTHTLFVDVRVPFPSKMKNWINKRREIANTYNKLLKGTSLILPKENKKNFHAYYVYVVQHSKRKNIMDKDVYRVNLVTDYLAKLNLSDEVQNYFSGRNILVTGGGIIPEADMLTLSQQGVGKLFGPGTPVNDTINYIKEWVSENRT